MISQERIRVLVERLAEQQAMPDDWWKSELESILAASAPANCCLGCTDECKVYGSQHPIAASAPALQAGQGEPVAQCFDGYLCRAWGETEIPCAEVVPDLGGVRRFFVREWLGSEDHQDAGGTNTLSSVMKEIESHDWNEEPWARTFEIGGVQVERVYSFSSPTHERAAPAPEPAYWESRWLETANTPHTWSEWQRCEPRNPYTDTAADKVREIQGYIDAGYKYELRALYATPSQPVAAEGVTGEQVCAEFDALSKRVQWNSLSAVNAAWHAFKCGVRFAAPGSAESKGDGNG
jgi:hypothetical protein